jgi:hypothetical protein
MLSIVTPANAGTAGLQVRHPRFAPSVQRSRIKSGTTRA